MSPPRSKVWICFTKNDSLTATCKICTDKIKHCGNTSNLLKHLKKHPNLPKSVAEMNAKILSQPKQMELSKQPINKRYIQLCNNYYYLIVFILNSFNMICLLLK